MEAPSIPLLLAAYTATIVLHELIHYIVARLAGVEGLRFVVDAKRGAIGFTYERATPMAIRVAALAPQLLTVVLLAVWLVTGAVEALLTAILNIVGSVNDLANSVKPVIPVPAERLDAPRLD
ncbi:DUF3267 domain-containing protein [Pyrolobus fumarii]|nr:DUF3267 domain-containing protein [Pyrolobus fumarii]